MRAEIDNLIQCISQQSFAGMNINRGCSSSLHSIPLRSQILPCFPEVVLLERRCPWKTRALRSNHNICGFVMAGFFCRFLLFGNFGLSWFMDMLFRFLGVLGKVFKDFPGDLEVLFYYER